MATATLYFANDSVHLDCRAVNARERLGEWTEIEIEAVSAEPVEPTTLLGGRCDIVLASPAGARVVGGTVVAFSARATSEPGAGRRYQLTVRSTFAVLELRRLSRIFQHLSVPDIVKEVVTGAGISADAIVTHLSGSYAPREYVVQYAETDAALVRRLCEEEGLYFRFAIEDGKERFYLEDTSSSAEAALGEALPVVDGSGLPGASCAYHPRVSLRRRVGKVTLRDYNQEKPALALEAVAKGGTQLEQQDVEVYEAPGRFMDPGLGKTRATRRLEGLRADVEVWTFEATALPVAPGLLVTLQSTPDLRGAARPEGDYFVVGVRTHVREAEHSIEVEAIPRATPFRLPRVTPRPRIHGIHSATVTGAAGEEIHVDAQGRVRVKFQWDRLGPGDDKSSLPVRVMQPNTPGSMLLPRMGWEVMVAFEDGDPDRPYVLGRTYNGKAPPPYALPANKTVTVLGTISSPGGGRQNQIRFDDAAGKQNVSFAAGFGKNTSVANNMMTQTVKNEALTVKASQSRSVGATETVSVKEGYLNTVGSQSALVGGMQQIFVKGDMTVGVGSETVVVGGACLEKVGNPVSGAAALAKAAALQGAGQLGAVGGALATAYSMGEAGYQGYKKGGWKGAAAAVGTAGAGMIAERFIPGGGTLLGTIQESAPAPWEDKPGAGGGDATGGGAAGASDTGGPAGPGPGYRNTSAHGAATELVGAIVSMTTPGTVGWSTVGASTFLVGGSHNIKTGQAGARTLGASIEALGSLSIQTSGDLKRDVKGPINTTIAGTLTSKASGKHSIKAGGALSIKVGGPLSMDASKITFVVGSATVTSSSSGLQIKADNIEITGVTKQSDASGHS